MRFTYKKMSLAFLFFFALVPTGCSHLGTVAVAEPGVAADSGQVMTVQPGDTAAVHYICRLKNGEVAAATFTVADSEPRSGIFVPVKEAASVSIQALRPDEPLQKRLWPGPFDTEIQERLMRKVAGMKEGETLRVELTAQMVPTPDEQSGFARLSRVRTRPRVMKMPRGDYEHRSQKSPEVGQPFAIDPAFPGEVESFNDQEVIIRFSATPGAIVHTPFGDGPVREEGDNYTIEIDAKEGRLVRSGQKIGRVAKVDEKSITIDFRHAFGYEELSCDVSIDKITRALPEAARKGE